MSGGHTPGPWLVNPLAAQIDVPGHDAPICGMLWPTNLRDERETEANARLIAAAPELLKALEGMLRASVTGGIEDAVLNALEAKARAAIAKAKGEAA